MRVGTQIYYHIYIISSKLYIIQIHLIEAKSCPNFREFDLTIKYVLIEYVYYIKINI